MSRRAVVSRALLMLLVASMATLLFDTGARALGSVGNGVYLCMTPPVYVAKTIGERFDMAVTISGVENLQTLEFTITYNTSLLDITQVALGTFFPLPPRSYFNVESNASLGFIKANMTLASSETPRSGNGTLVLIRFEVIQSPKSFSSSPINLQNTLLLDSASIPIVHDSVGAVYFWQSLQPDPPGEGQVLDLYTQRGGKGPNEPGGQFAAGELVDLYSQVTYNNSPLQQKLVAFEVRNPLNDSVLYRTATTNGDGLASTSFRIPDIPSSNGTWTAIAVVDIAGAIVWDTISFQVYFVSPVGGYSVPIESHSNASPITLYPAAILATGLILIMIKRKRKRIQSAP